MLGYWGMFGSLNPPPLHKIQKMELGLWMIKYRRNGKESEGKRSNPT